MPLRQLLEVTRDPYCFIVARDDDMVEYVNTQGERWRIYGTCSGCGECEPLTDSDIVFTGIPIGQPGATYRKNQLDVPVRPEISNPWKNPHCTLTGEYL